MKENLIILIFYIVLICAFILISFAIEKIFTLVCNYKNERRKAEQRHIEKRKKIREQKIKEQRQLITFKTAAEFDKYYEDSKKSIIGFNISLKEGGKDG